MGLLAKTVGNKEKVLKIKRTFGRNIGRTARSAEASRGKRKNETR